MAQIDLVLAGGGTKGCVHPGVVRAAEEAGHSIVRVAGTSAGAIAAAFIAAGMPADRLHALLVDTDMSTFADSTLLARLPFIGAALSEIIDQKIYRGKVLHTWITDQLAQAGVHTWKDLALDDSALPPSMRYHLQVVTCDLNLRQAVVLPRDYRQVYGLDPDVQLVADAVSMSAAIPFVFASRQLRSEIDHSDHDMVDGGISTLIPFEVFESASLPTPARPIVGINLTAVRNPAIAPESVDSALDRVQAVVATAIDGHDNMYLDSPLVRGRTVFVDTSDVNSTDFSISVAQREDLYQRGLTAGRAFFATFSPGATLEVQGVRQDAVTVATAGGLTDGAAPRPQGT